MDAHRKSGLTTSHPSPEIIAADVLNDAPGEFLVSGSWFGFGGIAWWGQMRVALGRDVWEAESGHGLRRFIDPIE